jgi:MIP family channel proteins
LILLNEWHKLTLFRIGVMLGVYTGGISGAHLNPAVTLSNCLYRKFPWRKFPIYLVAQTIGALCASAVVYANYKSAIDVFEGGPHIRTVPGYSDTATAGIFSTYPAKYLTTTGQFFDELIGSAVLMFMIYALKDEGNIGAGNLTPLGLFFVVFGIGTSFGSQTNFAINSARDFGPRLMTYMLGYGPQVWTSGNYYFWVSLMFSALIRWLIIGHRYPWSLPSLVALWADGCMICSCSLVTRPLILSLLDWHGSFDGTPPRGQTKIIPRSRVVRHNSDVDVGGMWRSGMMFIVCG